MGSVIKAVNRAYDRLETRPFWKVRGIAIVLVFLFGFTLIAVAVLIVFGAPLGQAIADKAHLGAAFTWLWAIVRWPVAFVAVLLLFAFVYHLAPNTDQRVWRWITPGSLVAAFMWLALSGLFALYVTFAGSYSKTYGSLATGVILLLWLNYTAWAILFGAELNSELDRAADVRAAGGEHAGPHEAGPPPDVGRRTFVRRAASRRSVPPAATIAERNRAPSSSVSVRSADWNATATATDFWPAGIGSPR